MIPKLNILILLTGSVLFAIEGRLDRGPQRGVGDVAAGGRSVKAFEYAVLRAVPRVERGELANVGVIVYSQEHDFLGASVHVDAGCGTRRLARVPGQTRTALGKEGARAARRGRLTK